jgi:heme ABC exporter ATP-binding subunit CcmA
LSFATSERAGNHRESGRRIPPVNFPAVVTTSGLELVEVVCLLGTFPALSGLSITSGPGEILAVEGPNGAGKTTFLRACAGLQPIASGSARVEGIDVRQDPRAVRRHVGYVGHKSLLYDDLTVEDNVRFAVEANASHGRARRTVTSSSVQTALNDVGIDRRVAKLPLHACSTGQRRRTALAAVVARKPAIWLLDEPHSGLDADAKESLDALLSGAASAGATVVVVSHDHQRVRSFATRAVTIAGGHLIESAQLPTGAEHAS